MIEILSLHPAGRDRTLKKKLSGRYEVKEYWLAAPETRPGEVLKLGKRGYEHERAGLHKEGEALESPLLPARRISVDEIF